MTDTEDIIRDPVSWVTGGLASIGGAAYAIGADPITAGAAFIDVAVAQASHVFTAASIAGFTIAPTIEWIPEGTITAIALVAGAIVVLKLVGRLWDAFTDRLGGA